ncbi:TOM (translocase of outer membrane) complex component [Tilletia horrida]|uniref:TOM (Translocase of outer membrane) complex component n=1 Tax=Tilletia horrida TaxID=155126 RepID=A0AAN6GCI0_9BASI|nr:TOM (translocase of outer membrane) complex component [Tilletia horrida]KAK0529473.1 TOM (translocase of outer membrane) complex component [Tilletia horrida]KAK0560404.1 TOM (translocase of outer membrane) complex component [Tilletia horrida]
MAPLPSAASSSTAGSASSSKLAKFVDENRTLLIASGAAISLGAAYYFLLGPGSAPSSRKGADSSSGASDKPAGKKKKHSKKKKAAGPASAADPLRDPEGPLVEEKSDEQLFDLSEDEIRRLPDDRRKSLAQALKIAGNKKYQARAFEDATELYTKALAAEEQAVFYSNRAACYSNRGQYENVIADCDRALKLDKAYIKALNRRAIAREALGKDPEEGEAGEHKRKLLSQALTDFTAVAILGQFRNDEATASVERVLKQLAQAQAKEIIRTREPKLPSSTFITAYLDAFRRKEPPTLPANPTEGDKILIEAYEAIGKKEYVSANAQFSSAIEAGLSDKDLEAHAYNMRGTFKFIIGDAPGALEDLNRSTQLKPDYVQSWVKKASVLMELSDKDEAFNVFDRAVQANADDPDIYYHRGQVYYIMGDYDAACEDYLKSTSLDDSFIFSQVQYAVAQYKMSHVERSTQAFQKVLRKFSSSSEAYNYYGELLLDQGRYEDAIAKFDKGIEIEANNPGSSNVLPMINKALAVFQWKQDLPAAEELCKRALEIDPDCDMAIATLAQLSLQQGRIKDAIGHFAKSAQMARTENELINAITYEYASRAQLEFIENFPEAGPSLPSLAAAMG